MSTTAPQEPARSMTALAACLREVRLIVPMLAAASVTVWEAFGH